MAEIYLARVPGVGIEGFEKLVVLKRILPQHALDPRAAAHVPRRGAAVGDAHPPARHRGLRRRHRRRRAVLRHGVRARREPARAHARAARAAGQDDAARELPLPHAIGDRRGGGRRGCTTRTSGGPGRRAAGDRPPRRLAVERARLVRRRGQGLGLRHREVGATSARRRRRARSRASSPTCRPSSAAASALDRRSDVFALGTILYELTTGAPPFAAESDYEILNRIVNGEPRAADACPTGPYPPALERDRAARAGARARRALPDGAGAAARRWRRSRATRGWRCRRSRWASYMQALFADDIAAWQRGAARGQVAGATPGRGRGGVGAPRRFDRSDRHRSERAGRRAAAARAARAGVRGGGAGARARGRRDRGVAARGRRAAQRQQRARAHAGDDARGQPGPTGADRTLPAHRRRRARAKASTAPHTGNTVESHSESPSAPRRPSQSALPDRAPRIPTWRRPRPRRGPRRLPLPRDRTRSRPGIPIRRSRRSAVSARS